MMYLIKFSKGPNSSSSVGSFKGIDSWEELLISSSGNFTSFFLFVFLCPFLLSFFFFFRSSLVIGRCSGSGVGVGSDEVVDDCCKSLHRIVQKFWCFSANLELEQRLHFLLKRSPSFSRGFAPASLPLVSPHPSQNSLCLARKADRKHFWHFLEVLVC